MNRLSYRIIFNTKRGQLVAVAECATSQGKSAGERSARQRIAPALRAVHARLRGALLCATALAAWLAIQPGVQAQVIADPRAPANQRPTILTNPMGGPLVNIQTPSAAGVSRNTYSRFDVGSSDTVILNNNRLSNPWLATGSARVILNEINSSNPSHLAGQIMVEGVAPGNARADVVFANPSGINVNGVSFFGAGRVTLTTGTPVLAGGALTGFNVTQGAVDIASMGMGVNGAGSYADIISRSAVIGGTVRADQAISVVTGPQTVDYATGATTPLEGTGAQPVLAIDTKALGGMYAGSITLLSTEAGVGVRNQGKLQANTGSGQLIVTADGRLQNTGRMDAAYTSVATVAGNIDNSGQLLGRQLLLASAGGDFNHTGEGLIQNQTTTSPLQDAVHTAYKLGAGAAQDAGSASQVFISARQDVNLSDDAKIESASSTTAADGTVKKGQVVLSAGRNVNLAASSNIHASGAVQVSSDGTVSGAATTIASASDEVTVLARQGIALNSSSVTGEKVHLETGAAFQETAANIAITGGQVNGAQQTAAIATGNLNLSTAGAAGVGSSAGHVFLQAGGDLTVAADSTLNAEGHFTASAGQALVLQGAAGSTATNGQVVNIQAGQGAQLLGDRIEMNGSSIKAAAGSIDVQASTGDIALSDRVTLAAGADLNVSAYGGSIMATGLQGTGANIHVMSNGATRLDQAATSDGPESSSLDASGDLTIGSIHQSGAVDIVSSDLLATGNIQLSTPGAVAFRTKMGRSWLRVPVVRGANVRIQGGSVDLPAATITATAGHVGVVAASGDLSMLGAPSHIAHAAIKATGNIGLHAEGAVKIQALSARAEGNLAVTSATGSIGSAHGTLVAKDMLSLSSMGGQTHASAYYAGGAMSVYNKTDDLTLTGMQLTTTGTTTEGLAAVSGQLSLESGGGATVDRSTKLDAATDLTLITGQGNITIAPDRSAVASSGLFLSQDQFTSSRALTVVARQGDLLLDGAPGTNAYGSSRRVSLATVGDLTLMGQNLTLKGSVLRANSGTLNLTASNGDLNIEANKATQYSQGFTNTYWDRAELLASNGIDARAAGDMNVNGVYVHTWGVASFLSGGDITTSGKLNRWQVDNRPSAGSSYNGWYQDEESINYSVITGVQGVKLGAMGGHLRLNGTMVHAENAEVSLRALGDVVLEAAMTDKVHAATSTRWERTWYGKKTTWTTYHNRAWRDANPVHVNARDISIQAGNNVATYASRLNAGNNLYIEAGDEAQYHAVKSETDHSDETQVKKSWIGIRYDKETEHTSSRISTPVVSTLYARNGNLTSYSGGDQLFQGTQAVYKTRDIQAGVGEKAREDARIVLEGVVKRIETDHSRESNYVVWQKQLNEGSVRETLMLPSFTGPDTTPFKAPGGISVQIPEGGDLKEQIQALSQQPGMGYLSELSQRSDVDWQPVKLAHEQWRYEQEGLTPAGAALLSVVVACVTGGAGAGLVGATGPVTSVMANAAFTSLASQAAITLVNNKGNIGKTLSDLAKSDTVKATLAAALTAGVLEKIGGLESMQGLRQSAEFTDKLTYNLVNAGGRALTNTAINGGDLEDALKQALVSGLVDTAHGKVASQIKVQGFDYLAHKLAHALAGCVAGAAAGGECRDGAIGSAVGEVVAEMLDGQKPGEGASKEQMIAYNQKVLAYSKLVAGAVSAYAGGNAQTAINTAEVAVLNNYLSKPQLTALQNELNACKQNKCTEAQTNAVLDKYAQLSASNDEALAACTTTACVEQHRKTLAEAATLSQEVMWEVGNLQASESLIGKLRGSERLNQGSTVQQLYARAERIEQARKQLDQYVQSQCIGLSSAACTTKLQDSQATAGVVTEIFAGFTPAGFAVDIKDLLQANTMQDRSLAVLGIVLPGLGDGVKALMRGARPIDGALADVWRLQPTDRGNAIESHLAATEYKDWFNVGQLNRGKFPLVDFQKDNVLVSLKTVDTNGSSWTRDMRDHIDDLSSGRATVNDKSPVMVLDLRVQSGGAAAAQWLAAYGRARGVAVRISEFK